MGLPRRAAVLLAGSLASSVGLALLWCDSGVGAGSPVGVAWVPLANGLDIESEIPDLAPVNVPMSQPEHGASDLSRVMSDVAAADRTARVIRLREWRVAGRVVDLGGRALAGHPVRVDTDALDIQRAVSDAAGAFEMTITKLSDRFEACAPGFVTVAATRAKRDTSGLVVAAPALPCSALVRDSRSGLPLVAARLTPVPSERLHTRLIETHQAVAAQGLGPLPPFVTSAFFPSSTDTSGTAQWQALPSGDCVDLLVSRPGYTDRRVSLEEAENGYLEIWLDPMQPAASWKGHVVNADGHPVPGASIRIESRSTRSRNGGTFSLAIGEGRPEHLDAFHPQHGRTRLHLTGLPEAPIEVQLQPHGEPLGARLVFAAPLPTSMLRLVPLTADGKPSLSAPPWRAIQVGSRDPLEIPPSMIGERRAAVDKNGTVLGYLLLQPGDITVAEKDP